jgi:5S rRNA maturation endonuclease (ribonuclease M5)
VLAAYDSELANVWDGFSRLPEPGGNPALDALVERKRISIASLVRLGARLSSPQVLAFAFDHGIKYRDMVTGARWSYFESEWKAMKIVRAAQPSKTVLVVEGETDGARCSDAYPVDVAIMPAGAEYFPVAYAEQLTDYDAVLVGLDTDAAGERGAAKIIAAVPRAQRFAPDGNDWCSLDALPPLPEPVPITKLLVSARELEDYDTPEQASWFEHELLPIGGLLLIHGSWKGFKSFLMLDMLAALSQAEPWCHFEPIEEQAKVAVVQFEIPAHYYKQRVDLLKQHAKDQDAFLDNFLTFSPRARPRLVAGDKASEDAILRPLVEAGVQVVAIDPIRRGMGLASMNDENEVRRMLGFFERLNDEGITVVATHHDNKASGKGGDPDAMTGSGAFAGDPDAIVSVAVPPKHSKRLPKRNLIFTLRNAPQITERSFGMGDDGRITYSTDGIGMDDDDDVEF